MKSCQRVVWLAAMVLASTLGLSSAGLWAQQSADNALQNGSPQMDGQDPQEMGTLFQQGDQITVTDEDGQESTGSVTVTTRGTFDLHAVNQPVRETLRQLASQSKRNIISTRAVEGDVTFDLYDVTLEEALNAIMVATGLTYIDQEGFIYVMTPDEKDEIIKSSMPRKTEVFTLYYLTAEDAQLLVQPALSDTAVITATPAAQTGIAASAENTGGDEHAAENLLVVTDYEANLKEVHRLLKNIDVRPKQVLIEATILSAQLDEDEALGVNMSILFNQSFTSLINPAETPLDFLTQGGDANLGSGANIANAAPQNLNDPMGGFNSQLTGNFPSDRPAVSIGVLTDNVSAFIEAIEAIRDVTVIANPKLMIVNKQRGEILIGQRDGYLTTTVTETTAVQTVEFLESGTRLLVRPFVGRDGVIRMEIHPEDSDGEVVQVGTGTDAPVLPNLRTTQVTSNIMVRDGRTIVIGGLFRDSITLDRQQLPGVGDVPVVGNAFRSTADSVERREIIILITPHIIDFPSAEAVSERLRDDVERYRIGARRGLQWWSRARMAENYYHWARRDMAKGNKDGAMWNVDMALTADPHYMDAIRLKEKLTGEAFWANSTRHVAGRYLVEQMLMDEMGVDYKTVTPPGQPLNINRLDPEVRRILGMQEAPTKSGLLPGNQTNDRNMTTQPPGVPAYGQPGPDEVKDESVPASNAQQGPLPAQEVAEDQLLQNTMTQELEDEAFNRNPDVREVREEPVYGSGQESTGDINTTSAEAE